MDETPWELRLEIRLDAGARDDDSGVDGVVVDASGVAIPFSGWLGLLGCLEELIGTHRTTTRAGQV